MDLLLDQDLLQLELLQLELHEFHVDHGRSARQVFAHEAEWEIHLGSVEWTDDENKRRTIRGTER